MIAKSFKFPLRKNQDIFYSARRVSFPFFTVWYLDKQEHTQTAVIVSKKVHKLATVRNKLKRSAYQALANILPNYSGITTIFSLKALVLELNQQELESQIIAALDQCQKS